MLNTASDRATIGTPSSKKEIETIPVDMTNPKYAGSSASRALPREAASVSP